MQSRVGRLMKRVSSIFGVTAAIIVLTLFFSLSISIPPAGAASLCDRFPSLSGTFPSCRDNPPPPPPAPPPAPPPEPPPTPSPTPPPTEDGRRNVCERYIISDRESPPESCDICPNVS